MEQEFFALYFIQNTNEEFLNNNYIAYKNISMCGYLRF